MPHPIFRFAFLAAAALCFPAARGQDLTAAVPANAKATVLVRDLDALWEQSEAYLDEAGLPLPRRRITDITGLFGNLGAAWQTKRGVAVSFAALKPDGAVVWFPVADGAATLAKLGGEEAPDGRKFDLAGQTRFAAARGNAIAVAGSPEGLRAAAGPALLDMLNAPQKQFAGADQVYFHINIAALGPELALLENNSAAIAELLRNVPALERLNLSPEQVAAALKRVAGALGREGKAIFGSINFSKDVAMLRVGIEFKPGSRGQQLAQALAAPAAASPYAKLPDAGCVAAFGLDVKCLTAALGAKGPLRDLELGAVGATLADHPSGATLLVRAAAADPAQVSGTCTGLIALAPLALGNRSGLKLATAAKKIGGVDVNELKVEFAGLPAPALASLKAAFGGADLRVQHGVAGDAFGIALGARDDAFAGLQAGGNLAAAPHVAAATRHLPPNALFGALVEPLAALRLVQRAALAGSPDSRFGKAALPTNPCPPFAAAGVFGADGAVLHIAAPASMLRQLAPALQALGQ